MSGVIVYHCCVAHKGFAYFAVEGRAVVPADGADPVGGVSVDSENGKATGIIERLEGKGSTLDEAVNDLEGRIAEWAMSSGVSYEIVWHEVE
ncbi:MAG: hypothetical protein AAGI88_05315 [Pseudomonadota bacterium]